MSKTFYPRIIIIPRHIMTCPRCNSTLIVSPACVISWLEPSGLLCDMNYFCQNPSHITTGLRIKHFKQIPLALAQERKITNWLNEHYRYRRGKLLPININHDCRLRYRLRAACNPLAARFRVRLRHRLHPPARMGYKRRKPIRMIKDTRPLE